ASMDSIAFYAPYYLNVFSAGNDRDNDGPGTDGGHYTFISGSWTWKTTTRDPDGEYDCIGHHGIAKNVLTVGSVLDIPDGYTQPSDVLIDFYSSWGPADDGRIKPDIVGNGRDLYSSYASSDTTYDYMTGTSMASPNVTGSMVLLQELYQSLHGGNPMRAATLKGLVIHTADEAGPANGPDYQHGWGLMNSVSAADVITGDGAGTLIIEYVLANSSTYTQQVHASGSEPLVATLCWTDPAGMPVSNTLNPRTPMLVHDLDLRITDTSTTYNPWRLNPDNPANAATRGDNVVDNVEKVHIASPTAGGLYTIRVEHKGALVSSPQNFSLVVSGVQTDDNERLVARYPLDSDVNDYSGNANHGVNNGVTFGREIVNQSSVFDGNSYALIPPSDDFNVDRLTMNTWLNTDDINQQSVIFLKEGNGINDTQYYMILYNGYIYFSTFNTSGVGHFFMLDVAPYMSNNTWHMITCTYDGNFKKIYVDGTEVASEQYTEVLKKSPGTAIIGSFGSSGILNFTGRLDEIRIYNYALDSQEISDLFDRPIIAVTPPSLSAVLPPGVRAVKTFTISNTGGNDLTFDLSIVPQGATAAKSHVITIPPPQAGSGSDGSFTALKTATTAQSQDSAEFQFDIEGELVLNTTSDILLIHAEANYSVLKTILEGYPDIGTVDTWYASTGGSIPALSDLLPYDVVIAWNNNTWIDNNAIGDVLADYIDGGGYVIATAHCWAQSPWESHGRYFDNGYSPFDFAGNRIYSSVSLGSYDASHIIMHGFTTLSDNKLNNVSLSADAFQIAEWNNGAPLVGTKHNTVAINVYPGDSYSWSGDFPTLIHNSVNYLTGNFDWARINPGQVPYTVPPQSSKSINVTFDSSSAYANVGETKNAVVSIDSNDHINTPLLSPALQLTVISLEPGLIAHYKMDGDINDSTYGHNTVNTGVTFTRGLKGGCGVFDGNSYAVIPPPNSFDVDNLTINTWLKTDDINQQGVIFEKTVNGIPNTQYLILLSSGNFYFRTYDTNGVQHELSIPVAQHMTNSTWHMLTCTYDGSFKKIYVDGNEVASIQYSLPLKKATGNAIIGSSGSGGSNNYTGRMDDLRVYNVALSQSEIITLIGSRIEGTVTDAINGYFLGSATVTVTPGGFTSQTDGSGNYVIDVLAGTFTVTARKFGYTSSAQNNVTVSTSSTATVDFSLSAFADFNSDGFVCLGDLVQLGNHWGQRDGDNGWDTMYDLSGDGAVGLSDLVLFGVEWNCALKVAKALPVNKDITIAMNTEFVPGSSEYAASIYVTNVDTITGIGFTVVYDAESLDYIENSLLGLGDIALINEVQPGQLEINAYTGNGDFEGTIGLEFTSRNNENWHFEIIGAEVIIDNESYVVDILPNMSLDATPTVFSLNQNHPNPFNPSTTLSFTLPEAGHTTFELFSVNGQMAATLVDSHLDAGIHSITWDGSGYSTGIYLYRLTSGGIVETKKMLLVK
ncbi:LamG-like jellyroll fold domain-containing protein, partial [Candidatus Omnitrophota bacterium]